MKRKFINYLTKKDIEEILVNCGYRLLTLEECEQQFGDIPYKRQEGAIACYCVVSPDDMREMLERRYDETHPRIKISDLSKKLSNTLAFMMAMCANMGDRYSFLTEKNERKDREFDTTYVRKVVFDDYFVQELKKNSKKQNLFEKAINETFEEYMNSKFHSYAKQREDYYTKLFSGELEDTL